MLTIPNDIPFGQMFELFRQTNHDREAILLRQTITKQA